MAIENLVGRADIYFQLLRFFIVLIVGVAITRGILMPLAARLVRRQDGDKKRVYSMANIVAVIGIFLSITVALQAGGFGNLLTVIGTVAAALTIAIGFGMREEVGNLVSGLFIQLNNPFVREDYVVAGEAEGVVKEITLRETRLRAPTGETVLVPNSTLSNNALQNRTRGRITQDTISVTVNPAAADTAESLFEEVAQDTEAVLGSPQPRIYFSAFEDDKLQLTFRYTMQDSENTKAVRDQVLRRFVRRAVEEGIFAEQV